MTTTIRTNNLSPFHAKAGVRMSLDRTRNAVKVRWPPAPGLELVVGLVERRVARRARVDALRRVMFVVFAGEGGFGAFFA